MVMTFFVFEHWSLSSWVVGWFALSLSKGSSHITSKYDSSCSPKQEHDIVEHKHNNYTLVSTQTREVDFLFCWTVSVELRKQETVTTITTYYMN